MYGDTRLRRWVYLGIAVALAGLVWSGWRLWNSPVRPYIPFVGALARPTPTALPEEEPPPSPTRPGEDELIALVQGYNQADVVANRNSDLAALLPYVHPNGPLYARLAAQYRARLAAGTYRHVQLTRFWAERPTIEEDRATVRTREIWDVTVVDAHTGQAVSSAAGIVTVQVYTILPDVTGVWRIWDLSALVENEP